MHKRKGLHLGDWTRRELRWALRHHDAAPLVVVILAVGFVIVVVSIMAICFNLNAEDRFGEAAPFLYAAAVLIGILTVGILFASSTLRKVTASKTGADGTSSTLAVHGRRSTKLRGTRPDLDKKVMSDLNAVRQYGRHRKEDAQEGWGESQQPD